MTSAVERALGILRAERERLEDVGDRIEAELERTRQELGRIERAVGALEGSSETQNVSEQVTKADVLGHVRALLKGEQMLPPEELRERVRRRLRMQGRALGGYSRRFGQVLRELHDVDGHHVALPPRN